MSLPRKFSISEPILSIGLLALTIILTYGALIPNLGFYRDDWYYLWAGQAQGLSGIIRLFQIDRPLIGWIYALDYMLLPNTPLAWQLLGLLERFIGVLGFFWLLRLLWPDRRVESTIMSLLFAVYPGYLQQPNATTFSNLLIAVAAVMFSFVFTVKAVQSKRMIGRVGFTVLSVLLALLYLGIFEVMIGLEAVRFLIVWLQRREPGWTAWRISFKRTLLAALPYLLMAFSFLFWRIFIFKSARHATNVDFLFSEYAAQQWRAPLTIFIETFKDMIETAIFAWVVPFYQFTVRDNYRDLGVGFLLGALVVIPAYFYIRSLRHEMDIEPQTQHKEFLWMGVLILFVTLLPVDAAGRNVMFSDQWDRYTLHAAIGVSFFVTGFLFYALRGVTRWILLLGLIGMSVVTQFHSAAYYRDFWKSTSNLWWQMSWRAPQIKPETMLFAIVPGASFAEGYEIYGPANMIYYPGNGIQIGADVLNAATATKIIRQDPKSHYDRGVLVEDHYENPLFGIFPTPNSCLHLLDGKKVELAGYVEDSLIANVADYSKIDRVDVSARPAILPANIFGPEPPRGWCYYYQKISLARQQGNWQEAAKLADESLGKDLTPEDVSEWMPILETYATLGKIKEAKRAAAIIRSDDNARRFLCIQLQKGPAYPAPYDYDTVNALLCGSN
ncbi:MAG: hypothetical protein HYR93_02625 [Chloroflexi bacterium]|nr:hypothetical protein [Chloroflexota bacterium]